jgi:hypothetical protein
MKSTDRLRRTLRSPVFIATIALVLRLLYLWTPPSRMQVGSIDGLGLGYEAGRIAQSIVSGRGYSSPFQAESGPTAWVPPALPFLLAADFKLFGMHSHAALVFILVLNEIFSAATCIPIFFASKIISGTGGRAAWLWAFYPYALLVPFYAARWYMSLSALLAACILFATFKILRSDRSSRWTGYGLLWGFELMTNAAFASIAPVLLVWLALRLRAARRAWIRLPGLAAAALVLVCAPWTIRNYAVFHTWVPLRPNFGFELWRFNNPAGPLHPTGDPPELALYVRLGETAYNREKKAEAFRIIRARPGTFAATTAHRIKEFWGGAESNSASTVVKWAGHWRSRALLATNLGLIVLTMGGLSFAWFRQREVFCPLVLFPLVFPLVYYITVSETVYRYPIDPILIVLAALGTEWIIPAQSGGDAENGSPGTETPRIHGSPDATERAV